MAEPLTPAEQFCVRRLKNKLSALQHHLRDALGVSSALTPDVHKACGFREQLAIVEAELGKLKAAVHGLPLPPEVKANG